MWSNPPKIICNMLLSRLSFKCRMAKVAGWRQSDLVSTQDWDGDRPFISSSSKGL